MLRACAPVILDVEFKTLWSPEREIDHSVVVGLAAGQRALRQQRNYEALNGAHRSLDERQPDDSAEREEPQKAAEARGPVRTWSHYGGMVPQQESANRWIRQNYEMRMAANDKAETGRGENDTQSQDIERDAELQEARETAEEARQREAQLQREREQERSR